MDHHNRLLLLAIVFALLVIPASATSINITYPANNSDINIVESTTPIEFTWTDDSTTYVHFIVYRYPLGTKTPATTLFDEYIYYSTTTTKILTGNYTYAVSANLPGGAATDINWFNLTMDLTGVTVQGQIYQYKSGERVGVPEATVYITNSTYADSQTTVTDINGNYIFTGLTVNSTYAVSAKAIDYDDSRVEYITPTESTVTKDILIQECTSAFTCGADLTYVPFTVKTRANGTTWPDVEVTVYKDQQQIQYQYAETDDNGQVTFRLSRTQRYQLNFYNSSLGLNETINLIPTDPQGYIIYVFGNYTAIQPGSSTPGTYNVTNTTKSWAVHNLTSGYLNSTLGIGTYGQGILASLILWVIVGAGSVISGVITCAVLAYFGIMAWGVFVVFCFGVMAMWFLGGRIA